MKVYVIEVSDYSNPRMYVAANSYADAERVFVNKHPWTKINSITQLSDNIDIQEE